MEPPLGGWDCSCTTVPVFHFPNICPLKYPLPEHWWSFYPWNCRALLIVPSLDDHANVKLGKGISQEFLFLQHIWKQRILIGVLSFIIFIEGFTFVMRTISLWSECLFKRSFDFEASGEFGWKFWTSFRRSQFWVIVKLFWVITWVYLVHRYLYVSIYVSIQVSIYIHLRTCINHSPQPPVIHVRNQFLVGLNTSSYSVN